MHLRILQSKLLFLHHLVTLPDESLAKEVYVVQQRLALPGLVHECQEFLVKFGITKVVKYTKTQWKTLVKAKILQMTESVIQKDKL